jgi:hypothetical protein
MTALLSLSILRSQPAIASEEIALIDQAAPTSGWRFDNGQEFPGAKGGFSADDSVEPQYRPALRLDGDFTGGGNYVQIGRDLPVADIESLSVWIKAPEGMGQTTMRLIDGTGQCHQFNLKVESHGEWQRILFPVARYFDKAGTSASVELVKRYEGWGGAADGKWHNPAKAVYMLLGRHSFGDALKGSLWIANARLQAAAPKTVLTKEVRLDDFLREGELDWGFNDGREFPGAKGGVSLVKNATDKGGNAVKISGDFTAGGAYVSSEHGLNGLDVKAIRMKVRTSNMKSFNVRLGDGTGQCHQGRGIQLAPDGEWHDVVIETAAVVGGEHWGGANDGKWHGDGRYVSIVVSRGSADDLKPEMLITDVRADVEVRAAVAGEAYKESFDGAADLPDGWTAKAPAGAVAVVSDASYEGRNALRVARAETQINDGVAVLGEVFAAAPGPWSLGGAMRSDLHSPDSSFAVRLDVEALDGAGNAIATTTLVDQTGKRNWKPFARQVDFPKGTAKARFAVTMHKTHGSCDIDALSATPLEVKGAEKIVERIVIGSDVVGNLFLPEEDVSFNLEVRSDRPLPAASQSASVTATDYWGAEQFPAQTVKLERSGVVDRRFRYLGTVSLKKDAFEIGKYYELHVALAPEGCEDAFEYSGFARLPEAESRQHPADQIPFTIRNWDSRIPDYFKLASRIGHRQIGTWGDSGWERIRDLGNLWYGGPSGVSTVEREGWKNITEEKLRQNAVDFMTRHKDNASLACIMLGNEPNERPELVAEKIRAYKIAYEALKSIQPEVKIVTTSVPPLETFFDAGYHKYTDVYDFHVYETYEGVRDAIRRYRALGRKHGAEKPIWCTELGLNSQGQTRHAVAQEVVKKITAFFAEGGANVSWFTIMYPDPNGKARGTSGDAHNTFDCQYSQYNPRLDAIMYYNMINGIAVKKFADEVQHGNGVQRYLFRDANGDCLDVLWKEGARVDCGVALSGVADARLIRIDGSGAALKPRDGAVTLGLSGEPVMMRYRQQKAAPLSRTLAAPSIEAPSSQTLTILKGQSREITVRGPGLKAADLTAAAPPFWKAAFRQDGRDGVVCTVTAPSETAARTGRVMLRRADASAEIVLSLAIMSPVSIDVAAASRNEAGEPTMRMLLRNNGADPATLDWTAEITASSPIENGSFTLNAPVPTTAYLKGETEGRATLEGGGAREAVIAIADAADQTIYRVRVNVADELGRKVVRERLVGGFATASRTATPVVIDGDLKEDVWSKAEVQRIDMADQVFRFGKGAEWKGASDLSAVWRSAWDAENLYLAVDVVDDVHRVQFADGGIWNQDGLQFLFDPARTETEKAGKYDYSVGVGTKGPQAWCHLSAHSSVNEGAAPFKVAATSLPGSPGGMRYEVAIPWTSLAPFKPEAGANLGMTMILNEDDGNGRVGFMGWFSGAHSKQLDLVGDVVLGQ